ncbi:MAG: hypothetical protein AABX00_05640 [Nanoarchaeota archaeon]
MTIANVNNLKLTKLEWKFIGISFIPGMVGLSLILGSKAENEGLDIFFGLLFIFGVFLRYLIYKKEKKEDQQNQSLKNPKDYLSAGYNVVSDSKGYLVLSKSRKFHIPAFLFWFMFTAMIGGIIYFIYWVTHKTITVTLTKNTSKKS